MKKIIIFVFIFFANQAIAQTNVKLGLMVTAGTAVTMEKSEVHSIPLDPLPVAPGVGLFYKWGHTHLNYELNSHSLQVLSEKSFKNGFEIYGFYSQGVQQEKNKYVAIGGDYPILVHNHLAITPFAEIGTNLKSKYLFTIGLTFYPKFQVWKRKNETNSPQ